MLINDSGLVNKSVELGEKSITNLPLQACQNCGKIMSAMPGTRDAICQNCGYKDPCCE